MTVPLREVTRDRASLYLENNCKNCWWIGSVVEVEESYPFLFNFHLFIIYQSELVLFCLHLFECLCVHIFLSLLFFLLRCFASFMMPLIYDPNMSSKEINSSTIVYFASTFPSCPSPFTFVYVVIRLMFQSLTF